MSTINRYIVFAKKGKYDVKDRITLIRELRKNYSVYFRIVDIRFASEHIEIDLISNQLSNLSKLKSLFELTCIRDLNIELKIDAFLLAKYFFNKERFWEVHEILENVWKKKEGNEKKILHGLILLAASYVHLQRGREKVALEVLQRSYDEFIDFKVKYRIFDLDLIKNMIERMLKDKKMVMFKI